jgi:hypothetical protein
VVVCEGELGYGSLQTTWRLFDSVYPNKDRTCHSQNLREAGLREM